MFLFSVYLWKGVLVHLFQLVLNPQFNQADPRAKYVYTSMLLDPGSGLKVSSWFFIIFFCCIFLLYSVFSL